MPVDTILLREFWVSIRNKYMTERVDKGDSWLNESANWHMNMLRCEVSELEQAILLRDYEQAMEECLDIVLFAFFCYHQISEGRVSFPGGLE